MTDEQKNESTPDLGDERMNAGMEVAFGGTSESVLDTLERLTGVKSKILLVDAAVDESPIVRVPGAGEDDEPEDDRRYQMLGEIARGGVGVVFKSRDRDLGRDVAIKVLRRDLANVPEIVQRFVEEAQIGGQLQHPGVVPVYGLGVQKDGRPYFAMKLVKGRTLAAILKDGGDRGRHIRTFERICQTVAYAHARNVIHRDLKPSNILVGAFGEVQVVDWGFAKVLARGGNADERRESPEIPDLSVIETIRSKAEGSTSRVGSVMGTPPYMPPEQARGDVEKLDERADVFSLGAILTEILTGEPPYLGEPREQILMAAEAKQDDCMSRLDACIADPDLVALAKRCLNPARAARPRHAGEVAEAVTAHLVSLEEKKHQAELSAAAAHRTRRMSLALAAAILVAVLAGGGGLHLADRAKRDRLDRAESAVNTKLKEANLLLGDARGAPPPDVTGWPAAIGAAEEAEELATELDAPEAVRTEAAALKTQIEKEATTARAAATRHTQVKALRESLSEIRASRGADFKLEDQDVDYGQALAERGIDVERLTPAEAAAEIGEWSCRDEIIAALDDWTRIRRQLGGDTAKLSAVLTVADPDETRSRIRAAAAAGDAIRLISATEAEELPPLTLLVLGEALGSAKRPDEVVEVYRRREKLRPDDISTALGLAHWLRECSTPSRHEVIAQLTKASVLRPRSLSVRYRLAQAYGAANLPEAQVASLREVYRVDPEFGGVRRRLHEAVFERCVKYEAGENFFALAEAAREATTLAPTDCRSWSYLAIGLALTGREEEARIAAVRTVETTGEHPGTRYRVAARLMTIADYERAARLLAPRAPNEPLPPAVRATYGVVLSMSGRLDDAIEQWEGCLEGAESVGEVEVNQHGVVLGPPFGMDLLSWLGQAELRAGRPERAIERWEARRQLMDDVFVQRDLARTWRALGDPKKERTHQLHAVAIQVRIMKTGVRGWGWYQYLGRLLGACYGPARAIEECGRLFPEATDSDRSGFLAGIAVELLPRGESAEVLLELGAEAVRLDPANFGAQRIYAQLLDAAGRCEEAVVAQRRYLHHCPTARRQVATQKLGAYLLSAGHFAEALKVYEGRMDEWPSRHRRTQVQAARLRIEYRDRIEELLRGSLVPSDQGELAAAGSVLARRGHPLAAVEMEKRLIEEFRKISRGRHESINLAARLMILSSFTLKAASDEDLTDDHRITLRRAALSALRQALGASLLQWRRFGPNDRGLDHERILGLWHLEPVFVRARDPEFLATITGDERDAWIQFWKDYQAHLDQVRW